MILKSFLSPSFLADIQQLKAVTNGTGRAHTRMPPLPDGFKVKNRNDAYTIFRSNKVVGQVDYVHEILPFIEMIVKKNLTRVTIRKMARGVFALYVDGKEVKIARSNKALKEYLKAHYD